MTNYCQYAFKVTLLASILRLRPPILAKNLYCLESLFAIMHHYIQPNDISSALFWMSTLCIIHKIYTISAFFFLLSSDHLIDAFFQVQKYDGAHSFTSTVVCIKFGRNTYYAYLDLKWSCSGQDGPHRPPWIFANPLVVLVPRETFFHRKHSIVEINF